MGIVAEVGNEDEARANGIVSDMVVKLGYL
jgi:hypothetical protein